MSTKHILLDHEQKGRLVRFHPFLDPNESEKRAIFMLPGLHTWLYESDRKKTLDYKANIRGFLGIFVKGKEIENCDYMKNLCPIEENIWELRICLQQKKEYTRIFGAFILPDTFICTHYKLRNALGFKGDPRWDAAMKRVEQEWDRLFPGIDRLNGRPFSNCVTFAAYDDFLGS